MDGVVVEQAKKLKRKKRKLAKLEALLLAEQKLVKQRKLVDVSSDEEAPTPTATATALVVATVVAKPSTIVDAMDV